MTGMGLNKEVLPPRPAPSLWDRPAVVARIVMYFAFGSVLIESAARLMGFGS